MTKKEAEARAGRLWKSRARKDGTILPDLIRYLLTDSGNAERLVALYGDDIRYCHPFRKWLHWDGIRWAIDDRGIALKLAKRGMMTFLHQAIERGNEIAERFAKQSLDARRLNAMLQLAAPELPIDPTELDKGHHLLNFTNGTVDLRDGQLHSHDRKNFITRLIAGNYNPDALCSRWLRFLDEVMGGGPDADETATDRAVELIIFLQLALGYSITGHVNEKVVFVCYGAGDNGKTTLLGIVRDLVLGYSATVGLDILTTRDDNNNTSAARAALFGARYVISSETEEGQRFSAARLKRICQGPGGMVEACRKYENPITFPETHKLWVDANHRPELPASDQAAWNRLRLIPFLISVPKSKQDRQLKNRLLEEGEGILAWLVQGATRWFAEGLPTSQIVIAATEEWRIETDRLRAFLDEKTEPADQWISSNVLFESYKNWAEQNNERGILSHTKFSTQLEAMGLTRLRKERGVVWSGIRFRNQAVRL